MAYKIKYRGLTIECDSVEEVWALIEDLRLRGRSRQEKDELVKLRAYQASSFAYTNRLAAAEQQLRDRVAAMAADVLASDNLEDAKLAVADAEAIDTALKNVTEALEAIGRGGPVVPPEDPVIPPVEPVE